MTKFSDLSRKSSSELASLMAMGQEGSDTHRIAAAEFLRREHDALIVATEAQKLAAAAAAETAQHTARSARYIAFSVVAIAIAAAVGAAATIGAAVLG